MRSSLPRTVACQSCLAASALSAFTFRSASIAAAPSASSCSSSSCFARTACSRAAVAFASCTRWGHWWGWCECQRCVQAASWSSQTHDTVCDAAGTR
ncbi:MAG: hypothetical protein WDW38_001933 [Sanguina aurantia]